MNATVLEDGVESPSDVRLLPVGWRLVPLSEIAETSSGGTPNSKTTSYYGGGIPWMTIGDLTDAEVTESARTISELGLSSSSVKLLPPGTLLIAMYGSIGKLGILGVSAATNQAICAIRPSDFVSVDFLFWYFKSVRQALDGIGRGGTQRNISQGDLKRWRVPLPPRRTQDFIVAAIEEAFDRLDAIETELDEADRLNGQFRRALLRDAFTGRLVTPGASRDSDAVDEEGRPALPEGWRWQPLSESATIQSGVTKNSKLQSGDEVPYLSTANVQAGMLQLDNVKTILAGPEQRARHRLVAGDVLVLEGGDPDKVGRGCVWTGEIADCLHQNHVFAVRPDQDVLLPDYLGQYVNSPHARAAFLSRAKQTTGIASINKTQLKSLPVPLPTLADQRAIIETLALNDLALERFARASSDIRIELKRMRAAILNRAFTGRLVPEPGSSAA